MSGVTYEPPTENLAIFDDSVFQANNLPLTPAQADKRYLKYPNAQGTENMQTTNVNGLLTMNAGGVVADTALTFQDAADDTGNISGTSGSLVLTALGDMTFYTNESGVYPLILSTGTTVMQADEIDINGNAQIALTGGNIFLDSGIASINMNGASLAIDNISMLIGTLMTSEIGIGNAASTLALTGSTVNLTADGNMTLDAGNNIVLQALNATNNAYIEFDTTFIRTTNNKEIDLQSIGEIILGTTANITLNGDEINSTATTSITLDAPADGAILAIQPSGNVDFAIATVGYVNSGYIPIGGALPVGTIIMWCGAYTGSSVMGDYLFCKGQSYANDITNPYPALYAAIGSNYNFYPNPDYWSLPNFSDTFPIGGSSAIPIPANPQTIILSPTGLIPPTQVAFGGSNTITTEQMPAHSHVIDCMETGANGGSSNAVNTGTFNNTQNTNNTGGNAPYAPPFCAVWFLIKFQ